MRTFEFHFDLRSPYSYLALTQIGDLAFTLHPFDVIDVMQRVNNTPTTITCKAKGIYARADMARWARRYRIPFNRNPQMRDIDGRRLLRALLAVPDGSARRAATEALFAALWRDPVALVTPGEVTACLAAAGVPVEGDLAGDIDSPALEARLDAANAAAAERGVFGSPTFIAGDEMFFGNDRLDFLREALEEVA